MRFLERIVAWWRIDTYQDPQNDDAKILLAVLVSEALHKTYPTSSEKIDRGLDALRDGRWPEPVEEPRSYTGMFHVGKRLTRMPDWLMGAAQKHILELSDDEWRFKQISYEKGAIKYVIARQS